MLIHQPFWAALIINVFLGTVWHFACFLCCVYRNVSAFSPENKMFRPHKWEKDGHFYADLLRINKWKRLLPQHIGKNGFSKDHLEDISLEYIDEFIMETCRGEWNHTMNCLFSVVLLLINPLTMGLTLALLCTLGNLPFIAVQRYNRLRLQKLKRLLIKKQMRRKAAGTATQKTPLPDKSTASAAAPEQ